MATLGTELKFFTENKANLAKNHLGKFALIKEDKLIGIFDNAEAAISEGATQFGRDSFLVRQIELNDQEVYIPALTLGLINASIA